MANSFFTVAAISKEMVRLMENDLVLGKSVGTDNLENETVKSGGAVKVRRQMQYLGQDNNLDLSAFSEDVTPVKPPKRFVTPDISIIAGSLLMLEGG